MNLLRYTKVLYRSEKGGVAVDWIVMALAIVALCIGLLTSSRPGREEVRKIDPPAFDAAEKVFETFP